MSSAPHKPSRAKRLLQNLALSGVVLLICILVLEIVLRLCGFGNLEIYQSDPKLYWRLKPNQECFTKIDHKPVHVNSQSVRGPEFQTDKPGNTLRIISLGDSRTFGWGLTDGETYSRLLERSLQDYVGDSRRVEVINAGVNAWSHPQMLVYFRDYALRYRPDFVILAEATPWTQFSENNSPKFVNQFMWRVRLKNILRRFAIYHYVVEVQLKEFYERHRAKFIPVDPTRDDLFKIQQQSDADAVFYRAIRGLCSLASSNGVQPVLLFIPMTQELEATNASSLLLIKRQVSAELGVPLVDTTDDLKPQGKALYLDADPVHLNAPGNEILARRVFETMTNLIAR